ncbi:MAG: hypothetical protein LBE03_00450 [Candidatus Nomurabacteria bacterium]|jgi:uncharacterized membrane protein SpoIIM required for sporulation|nr:hypothetical protein [Candidatus Nomurabacteria bacterium]
MDPNNNKDKLFGANNDKKVSDFASNHPVHEQNSPEHFQKNALNGKEDPGAHKDKLSFTNPFAKNNRKDSEKNVVDLISGSSPEKTSKQKLITIVLCIIGVLVVAGIIAALFIISNKKSDSSVEPEKPLFGSENNDWNTTDNPEGLTCIIDTAEDKTFAFTGFDTLSIKRNVVFSKAGTALTAKSDYMYSFNDEAVIDPFFSNFKQLYEGKYPVKDDYYFSSSLTKSKTGFLLSIDGVIVNIRYDEYLAIFGLVVNYTDDEQVSYYWNDADQLKSHWESEGYTCTLADAN